jgi:Domain of unknown function (DUF4351)
MHDYDVALKDIITRPGSALLPALTGAPSLRWLNVELPKVNNLRVDLLGESTGGDLIHIELQVRNEKHFPLRMAEYLLGIRRRYGRFPRQVVLFVGDTRLRRASSIEVPNLSFHFHIVDIRDLDGESLLASENMGDNVIAILTRLGDRPDTVRRILKRIAEAPAGGRDEALGELFILAGLRKLTGEVARETKKMPILKDIRDDEFIGSLIREGRAEGQMEILLDLVEKRFGGITPRIRKRLASLNPAEIKAASLRLLDARRVEDLFSPNRD